MTDFESNRKRGAIPSFSICIPQYNRTEFLIKACATFASQSFTDFELCISDDCSTDGNVDNLLAYLRRSGFVYTYARGPDNVRYDGNLRRAIGLSAGRYLLLMGNDDGLNGPTVLQHIHDQLARYAPVDVAITNYRELGTGRIFRRVGATKMLGSGPQLAATVFRNYSFVSGLVLPGETARSLATTVVDGSEMYQMYLATRIIAQGGRLLAIDRICIDKDLQIADQTVDSYRQKPRMSPCPIQKRHLPMGRLLEVVGKGLSSTASPSQRDSLLFRAACSLYAFTYPFWGVEYRRVQSWRYAAGIMLALNPGDTTRDLGLSVISRALLWLIYGLSSMIALSTPIWLFDLLHTRLYAAAKKAGAR